MEWEQYRLNLILKSEAKGREEGREEGAIQEAVKLYNEEMGLSPLQIMRKIMDRFGLREDDAKSYVEDTLGVKLELEMV